MAVGSRRATLSFCASANGTNGQPSETQLLTTYRTSSVFILPRVFLGTIVPGLGSCLSVCPDAWLVCRLGYSSSTGRTCQSAAKI